MKAFCGCHEDRNVFFWVRVLRQSLIPCSIGYVGRFGWIIRQRKFFKALGLGDGIIEYMLESTGGASILILVRAVC